jgi:hypothetical protein
MSCARRLRVLHFTTKNKSANATRRQLALGHLGQPACHTPPAHHHGGGHTPPARCVRIMRPSGAFMPCSDAPRPCPGRYPMAASSWKPLLLRVKPCEIHLHLLSCTSIISVTDLPFKMLMSASEVATPWPLSDWCAPLANPSQSSGSVQASNLHTWTRRV